MSQSPNKLLAALARGEYRRLQPLLRTLTLPAEAALPHCGHTRVYFPGTGLCSIINRMADGSAIEVACVGSEGLVGLSALAGESVPERNGFVQVGDGTVQYMPMNLFERELARYGELRELVDGYCHTFLEATIQSVACNRLHSVDERCCRWLLAVRDRLGRARFELKPRFLARALGVRNAEVTSVLARLEQAGVVAHDAWSLTVVDDVGLRRMACRCYDAMKHGYTPVVTLAPKPAGPQKQGGARVLTMRPGVSACTLCGSSARVPHKDGHECILALDEEISTLTRRTHMLRKYRAQLLANRAQLFRDILKRSRQS